MFPVTLSGPRIALREFRSDDAPAIFRYASNPVVSAYGTWDAHSDIEETADFLTSLLASARVPDRSGYTLAAIADDGNGGAGNAGAGNAGAGNQLIGSGRISVRDALHRRGDIGYVLHPDWWSNGFGTEIAALLIQFGFETLGLHRIEATAHPDNIGSQRVLEKAGMRYEGRIRDHMLINGVWRDSLSYGIIETDRRTSR